MVKDHPTGCSRHVTFFLTSQSKISSSLSRKLFILHTKLQQSKEKNKNSSNKALIQGLNQFLIVHKSAQTSLETARDQLQAPSRTWQELQRRTPELTKHSRYYSTPPSLLLKHILQQSACYREALSPSCKYCTLLLNVLFEEDYSSVNNLLTPTFK